MGTATGTAIGTDMAIGTDATTAGATATGAGAAGIGAGIIATIMAGGAGTGAVVIGKRYSRNAIKQKPRASGVFAVNVQQSSNPAAASVAPG